MDAPAERHRTFCPHCQREVEVAITPPPPRDGHANLPEGGEVVCLEFGGDCTGEDLCPLAGTSPVVMGVRLARSGLREEWETVRAVCEGCGQVAELEILDREHAFCPVCGTTNTWMVIEVEGGAHIAVTRRKD